MKKKNILLKEIATFYNFGDSIVAETQQQERIVMYSKKYINSKYTLKESLKIIIKRIKKKGF